MNKIFRAVVGLIVAGTALTAFAQTPQEMRPYLSANYNYIFQDSDRASENGSGYSFSAGKALNKYWGIEFGGFHDQFKQNTGGASWREYGAKLDGLFFYSRNPAFSPYFGLGVGGMQTDRRTTGDSSFDPFVDAGVGFFKFFSVGEHDLGIRADVRYRWVNANDIPGVRDFREPIVKVGLVLPLGPRPSSVSGATAPGSGAYGAAGRKVGDADGDGVLDDQDLCPDTPAVAKVDENGCSEEQARGLKQGPNRSFEDVHFEFDHSDLTDYGKVILDNAAGAINGLAQKYPSLKIDLSGNTDWIGTEGYNQALSERRADTVKKYLSRKGVDANRVTTHAYGETKPTADNNTAEGRALNRRVEIRTHAE
ncbi:MAG: OmpA family protein [Rhodanobacter sp.]